MAQFLRPFTNTCLGMILPLTHFTEEEIDACQDHQDSMLWGVSLYRMFFLTLNATPEMRDGVTVATSR